MRCDLLLRKVIEGKNEEDQAQPLNGQEWQPNMQATERNGTTKRTLVASRAEHPNKIAAWIYKPTFLTTRLA